MRRRLLKTWPALAHWFRVMPWDAGRLTVDELNEFVAAIPKRRGGD